MTTPPPTKTNLKPVVGIAAAACIACCIGPILAVLGAIAALGVVSSIFIGAAGLVIAAAAITTFVVVRRRKRTRPAATVEAVPVQLGRTSRVG